MLDADAKEAWSRFLEHAKKNCSSLASFENWLAPIQLVQGNREKVTLEVPNIFVKEYLLNTYKKDLCAFLPLKNPGEPAIEFVIAKKSKLIAPASKIITEPEEKERLPDSPLHQNNLNQLYTFANYVEGPSNQFVKSAAMGVASRPGRSYNPLFIHGGVGLGKTHLLHSIGHYISERFSNYRIQCITTEAFINDLVGSLRNKSVDKWKDYYRNSVDVLLVDDIQFLQDRPNFEEEFCNTFESLIHQNKQIVIASDKPPGQLKLSERMIARMEWGLVANVGIPELETRVAIIQVKAELKGIKISQDMAFYMAENIQGNVRQIEGAVNRLTAQARLLNQPITQDFIEKTLAEVLHHNPSSRISVEQILKSVAAAFQIKVSDLKGQSRTKEVAMPRQVAMFLSKELVTTESLSMLGAYFGKTHSTLLHAHKAVQKKLTEDKTLQRQVEMIKRNIGA